MQVPQENEIQAELLRLYSRSNYEQELQPRAIGRQGDVGNQAISNEAHEEEHAKAHHEIHEHHRPVLRAVRSWSWPIDHQQRSRIPLILPPQPFVAARRRPKPRLRLQINRLQLWCAFIICSVSYISVGIWRYVTAPEPSILHGWPDSCPATWLYTDWPEMVLLGYQGRYKDIKPRWKEVHSAKLAYTRCWHGDRNIRYQDNSLNLTFPLGTWSEGGLNWKILERGEHAYKMLTRRWPPPKPAADGLVVCGSACAHRCRLRDALKTFAMAALNPFSDLTARHPQTVNDLPHYCPCSIRFAISNMRQTYKHLPLPRSIHSFYVNREKSSLYEQWDPFSFWVWLWGNDFFVPWRRTNIDDVGDDEMRELYIQGFWHWYNGGRRFLSSEDVRDARGVRLSRRELAEIMERCKGDESCARRKIRLE